MGRGLSQGLGEQFTVRFIEPLQSGDGSCSKRITLDCFRRGHLPRQDITPGPVCSGPPGGITAHPFSIRRIHEINQGLVARTTAVNDASHQTRTEYPRRWLSRVLEMTA
jgi:hypothetical protein